MCLNELACANKTFPKNDSIKVGLAHDIHQPKSQVNAGPMVENYFHQPQ